MTIRTLTLAGLVIASAAAQPATSSDWPRWRGPKNDGTVTAPLPAQWPAALSKKWEVSVGAGHSSPVISGNRVVAMARQEDREIVRALDLATGKEIWRAENPAPYTVNPAAQSHGPGPKSTPAVAGGRVFTFGISGILSAFDLATGKLLWRVPSPSVLPQYGTATSPLVDGTAVIVHVGGHNNGAVTAFDAATGKPRWQWKGDGPGYGSPIIATIGGSRQLILQTQKLFVGLDSRTGAELWQMPFPTAYNQSAVTPVVVGDLVVISGLDKGVMAVRPTKKGVQWTPDVVWKNDQVSMFMNSPFVSGTTIVGLSSKSKGQLFALDASSGKTLWTTQGREGENASVMGNPSWLLVSTTNGELIVGKPAADKFAEVRRYQVSDSAMWAHPAIAGRSIVVKGVDKVVCWNW